MIVLLSMCNGRPIRNAAKEYMIFTWRLLSIMISVLLIPILKPLSKE